MKRIWGWIVSWFGAARAHRHVAELNRRLDYAQAQCEFQMRRLEEMKNEVESKVVEFEHRAREAERSHKQYEAALETVRTENDVYKHGVNTLVRMHQSICTRYEADMAIQERRKAAASFREEG